MLDVLCFSEQYYAILALYGFGATIGMYGLSIVIRNKYNLFGDPAFILIILVIFIIGDFLQYLLVYLSGLKVRSAAQSFRRNK